MSEWISVEDKLPDDDCLVYMPDSRGLKVHSAKLVDGKICTVGHHFHFDEKPITHWQPLPEPPEEKP